MFSCEELGEHSDLTGEIIGVLDETADPDQSAGLERGH
jgi:hypothetical protein